MERDVYYGYLKLEGEEDDRTLTAANNFASCLTTLERFEEAKSLLRKMTPVARRVLGESHDLTLRMRMNHAQSLYEDPAAPLCDLREAATTLEDLTRTARRVLGSAHPDTAWLEQSLQCAQEILRLRTQ